jgi:hypothetical protein
MAQQIVNDADTGLSARNKINANCTELYANLNLPIKIPGMSANYNQAIGANAMVTNINIAPVDDGPITLRIGITANGQEILGDTVIAAPQPVQAMQLFTSAGTLYFTFTSGMGTLNVRIDVINNFN